MGYGFLLTYRALGISAFSCLAEGQRGDVVEHSGGYGPGCVTGMIILQNCVTCLSLRFF